MIIYGMNGPSEVRMSFEEYAALVLTINEYQRKILVLEQAIASSANPKVAMNKPAALPATEKSIPKSRKAVKAKPAIKDTKTKKSGPSSKIRWTKKRSAEHGAKVKAGKALKKLNPDAKAEKN